MDREAMLKLLEELANAQVTSPLLPQLTDKIALAQCHLLLGILDKLDEIEGRLISIDREIWVRNEVVQA